MRNSKQRDLIQNIVNASSTHPTAEEVYNKAREKMPNISLGTVYRNLNMLVENNNLRKLKTSTDTYRYDNSFLKHNHFICRVCDAVYDVDINKVTFTKNLEGNIVESIDVTYFGICKNCKFKEGLK